MMMTPFQKLTNEEILAIKSYIDDNAEAPMDCSLAFLLREWDAQKTPLFKNVFKDNLIVKEDVSFAVSTDQISDDIRAAWYQMPKNAKNFYDQFITFCAGKRRALWTRKPIMSRSNEDFEMENAWYDTEALFNDYYLATNKVDKDYYLPLDTFKADGTRKKYHIQEGSKPMRIIGKIIKLFPDEEWNESGYKDFCVWHSQFLNQKKITGKLCLSIHPLDYMTMSDNSNDWNSCMSWTDNGCYRGGTVEMMNSPMVVVAYIESNSESFHMRYWDDDNATSKILEWNSKKWRSLIVLNEYGIFNVKGYPYQHDELSIKAMEILAKMTGLNYTKPAKYEPFKSYELDDTFDNFRVSICPSTDRMYNDFGSATHYAMFNEDQFYYAKKNGTDWYINFKYSGLSECMSCGSLDARFGSEENLCCCDCFRDEDSYVYCEECGCACDPDEAFWVGDSAVCPDCFNEKCFEDAFTYEFYFKEDGITLNVIPEDATDAIRVGMVYADTFYEFLTDDEKYDLSEDSVTVKAEDFNEKGSRFWNKFYKNYKSRKSLCF